MEELRHGRKRGGHERIGGIKLCFLDGRCLAMYVCMYVCYESREETRREKNMLLGRFRLGLRICIAAAASCNI